MAAASLLCLPSSSWLLRNSSKANGSALIALQAATLLTKKELVAFLIRFGFPADPPKGAEIRGAEQARAGVEFFFPVPVYVRVFSLCVQGWLRYFQAGLGCMSTT